MHGQRYDMGDLSIEDIKRLREKGDVKNNGEDNYDTEVSIQRNAEFKEQLRHMLHTESS